MNLKPCPFCGHDTPEFERMGDRRQSCIVICGMCGCRHESSDEGDRCGASWNTRKDDVKTELLAACQLTATTIQRILIDADQTGQPFDLRIVPAIDAILTAIEKATEENQP